jgi:hypothetical protein
MLVPNLKPQSSLLCWCVVGMLTFFVQAEPLLAQQGSFSDRLHP